MPDFREIKCHKCGHKWHVDMEKLDEKDQVVYKSTEQKKVYQVECPNCHTTNVFEA
jgi:ribosomal protein S27E